MSEEKKQIDPLEVGMEATLSTNVGRAFLWNILCGTGMFANTFTGEATHDANASGMRNVGLKLWHEAQAVSHANFILMMQENKDV